LQLKIIRSFQQNKDASAISLKLYFKHLLTFKFIYKRLKTIFRLGFNNLKFNAVFKLEAVFLRLQSNTP